MKKLKPSPQYAAREWRKMAEHALFTLPIAMERDTHGYKRPNQLFFTALKDQLIEWCRDRVNGIDWSPIDELWCILLFAPQDVPPELEVRGIWKSCESILDEIERAQADSKPDTEINTLPDSVDVRDLCRALQKGLSAGKTQTEVARDFTGGNVKKADNLLRQARRYRYLWQ